MAADRRGKARRQVEESGNGNGGGWERKAWGSWGRVGGKAFAGEEGKEIGGEGGEKGKGMHIFTFVFTPSLNRERGRNPNSIIYC